MAKKEKLPKTNATEVEGLIERLKGSQLKPGDAELIERLLRTVVMLLDVLERKNLSIKKLWKIKRETGEMANWKDNHIVVRIYTTKYLGIKDVAIHLINILSQFGMQYIPERWGVEEDPRFVFDPNNLTPVIEAWSAPKEFKYIFFFRKRPAPSQICITMERFEHAKFNYINCYISDKNFKTNDKEKVKDLLQLTIELCSCLGAVYGFIAHRKQEMRQSHVLTPAERLSGIYWANFFGRPYIDFFGREKLLAAPCYEVRQINKDLILLLTAESPYQPEMLGNDDITNVTKAYLDQNAFAGPRFPDEPCAVPEFDFSDLRVGVEAKTQDQLPSNFVDDLKAKGYKLIKQSKHQLTFQGKDKSVVIIDLKTGNISFDISGT